MYAILFSKVIESKCPRLVKIMLKKHIASYFISRKKTSLVASGVMPFPVWLKKTRYCR